MSKKQLPPVAVGIADLIGRRAFALGVALGREEMAMLDSEPAALRLASRLLAGDPIAGAAVLELAWPDCDPPATWWSTPLGAVCRSAFDDGDGVDLEVAAHCLGVTPRALAGDVEGGLLQRHDRGGVTVASLRGRLREERPGLFADL
jgi:hypothetical protein